MPSFHERWTTAIMSTSWFVFFSREEPVNSGFTLLNLTWFSVVNFYTNPGLVFVILHDCVMYKSVFKLQR